MALLYARERAAIQKARSTSAIPERNCRLNIEVLDFSQEEINGKLIIDNLVAETIPIAGIFVRCEINEYVKVETRFDGRAETKIRSENILSKESWATVYVLGEDSNVCKLTIPARRSEYLFTFNLKEARIRQFPASFKATNGNIMYQVVAYIQRPYPDDKIYYQKLIGITPPHNPGYFDLSKDPLSTHLIAAEKSIQKSFFSKRTSFRALLQVNKTGFLAGEALPFTVSMNNISGETVTRASISLVRRIVWRTTADCKNSLTVLDSKVNKEVGREAEDVWSDSLQIPNTIGPTAGGVIEFQYFLRMEILLSERVPVKSETSILIGTTWGDARTDDAIRPKLGSTVLRQSSTESAQSTISSPPNYSALSSRKPSIETLPPGYEDAIGGEVKNLDLTSLPEDAE